MTRVRRGKIERDAQLKYIVLGKKQQRRALTPKMSSVTKDGVSLILVEEGRRRARRKVTSAIITPRKGVVRIFRERKIFAKKNSQVLKNRDF